MVSFYICTRQIFFFARVVFSSFQYQHLLMQYRVNLIYKETDEIFAKKEASNSIHFSKLQNAISRVTAITGILVILPTLHAF